MMGPLNDQTKFDIDKFEKQATDPDRQLCRKGDRKARDEEART